MDSKTSVCITILLGLITWYTRFHSKIVRYLWCHFFGLQFLVYSIGTGFYSLAQEVHQSRTRQEEILRSLEASQGIFEGLHSQFSSDLGVLKRKVERINHSQGAAADLFRAEIIRQRDQLAATTRLVQETNHLTHNIKNTTLNIYLLIFRASQQQQEARQRNQNQNQSEHNSEASEISTLTNQVSQGTQEDPPFNDYSGNEAPAPDSPIGPTSNLAGEQETSSETSTQNLSSTSQTTGERDTHRINWVIGEIIRRDIQRVIDSDSDSSTNSQYPDSRDTDSD